MLGKLSLVLLLLGVWQGYADTYLHHPRGSNDRLNGQGRDRTNGNRLFDSQDNNRGGYNRGSTYGNEYYYEGTLLPIQWTVQHSCGHPNINCEIIMQYMCEGFIRDGQTESTIPDDMELDLYDQRYGRHESYSWYQSCKARSRNRGLFIADRQLNGRGAIFTRQNNNGNRHGYECPEERDYYPYWHPSPWKDIAILTDNPARCDSYKAESQNVKSRFYCAPDPDWQARMLSGEETGQREYGFIPITPTECEGLSPPGTWTELPAWNLPAPDCLPNVWTRDNHLGTPAYNFADKMNSTTISEYNWVLPNITSDPLIYQIDPLTGEQHSEHCVFRLRYNMTSAEFETPLPTSLPVNPLTDYPTPSTQNGGFSSPYSAVGTTSNADWTKNSARGRQGPSRVDVWSRYGLLQTDVQGNLDEVIPNDRTDTQRLAAYTNKPSMRGYVLQGNDENPWVDIFGGLVPLNQRIFHQLAVDTSQFGRTFQDRSHMFSVRQRPAALVGAKIHNFGVRGKRGNNQQTYPATEYEFTPERFKITKGDMVHFQWNGANTNNQGNAGQGTRGTDRSNVIVLVQKYQEMNVNAYGSGENHYNLNVGQFQTNYPSRIDDASDSVNAPFLGYQYDELRRLAKEGIYNPYFDLGPRQVTRVGVWHYMSTRNNNFTNRGQKGLIQVENTADGTIEPVLWGSVYNKRVTDSGDSWLLDDQYKFPVSADVFLKGWGKDPYYDSEWAQLMPVRFSVTPGSYQLMAMKFNYYPFMTPKVYWATNTEGQMMTEVKASGVYTNVVEFQVNQGGFYVVKNAPDPGMIVGLVVAAIVICGGGGYACFRYKKGWQLKPSSSSTGADVPLNTSARGHTSDTGVEI